MLSVASIKSASGAASYFAKDDYYTAEHSSEATLWGGVGAAEIGLKGEVTGHVSSAPGVIVYESAPRPADHVAAAGAGGARATIDA